MTTDEKVRRRHVRVYAFLHAIAAPIFSRIFRFRYKKPAADIEGPYIVLANHNMDCDPILVGIAFKRQMYFVASEHIFRRQWLSKLLVRYLDPIARKKGTTAAGTVLEMARRAKKGYNLALFPEGDRSFTGRTDRVHPTVGKLVKKLGIKVITYRIRGGFLTTPRWSYSMRKGLVDGEIVHIYPKEEVAAMTADELLQRINEDLYVDAYEDQQKMHIAYKGKNLAEGLETALWICPECGRIGSMSTKGDTISCTCGMHAHYDQYGMLTGTKFSTFTEWYDWQRAEFDRRIDEGTVEMPKEKVTVVELNGEEQTKVAEGSISVGANRITVTGEDGNVTDIDDVHSVGLYTQNHMVFEAGKKYYEVLCDKSFCARKYIRMFCRLSGLETGV